MFASMQFSVLQCTACDMRQENELCAFWDAQKPMHFLTSACRSCAKHTKDGRLHVLTSGSIRIRQDSSGFEDFSNIGYLKINGFEEI